MHPPKGVYRMTVNNNMPNVYQVGAAQTPYLYNVTCTVQDTEYSQTLPAGTKKFNIISRDGTPFRLAYETGYVAGPTAPYRTCLIKNEDNLNCQDLTLYVASAVAGNVIEIEAWV